MIHIWNVVSTSMFPFWCTCSSPLLVDDGVCMNISVAVLSCWGKRREWYNVPCGDEGEWACFTVDETWQEQWNTTYTVMQLGILLLIIGQVKGKLLSSVPNCHLSCIIQCPLDDSKWFLNQSESEILILGTKPREPLQKKWLWMWISS